MAIVINEMVFRATLGAGTEKSKDRGTPKGKPADPKDLVEACVEEVLRVLREERER